MNMMIVIQGKDEKDSTLKRVLKKEFKTQNIPFKSINCKGLSQREIFCETQVLLSGTPDLSFIILENFPKINHRENDPSHKDNHNTWMKLLSDMLFDYNTTVFLEYNQAPDCRLSTTLEISSYFIVKNISNKNRYSIKKNRLGMTGDGFTKEFILDSLNEIRKMFLRNKAIVA